MAHAQWYPRVDLAAQYGQAIWSYTLAGPPTVNVNEPQYAAVVYAAGSIARPPGR
ncbi:MAG TPA: hypothetical protein VND20_05565 [Candidatus Binataceae bacterium]|nr:hypothetical protein [Candidatus Binataceae bacterium]